MSLIAQDEPTPTMVPAHCYGPGCPEYYRKLGITHHWVMTPVAAGPARILPVSRWKRLLAVFS